MLNAHNRSSTLWTKSDIVLLGHSFGGTIIAKVAEAIGSHSTAHLLRCFVLNDGESRDSLPPHYQALFDSLARESDDHTLVMPFELWREVLLNDADLELARSSYARLSPEPYQPWIDKLDLKQFYSLPIPKSYPTVQKIMPPSRRVGLASQNV